MYTEMQSAGVTKNENYRNWAGGGGLRTIQKGGALPISMCPLTGYHHI